jgi:PAS domain S-box-containing protein
MEQSSTILIADDERGIRDVFSSLLAGPDYRLLFADNGKDAVEAALTHAPDLLLLDVMMPGIDGFEVCRRLRSDPRTKEIPILIITALNDHRSRLKGIDSGADDFISKPFDLDELEARVKSITRLNRYRTLLSERMKFERLFDLSPDGIIIVDSRHNILLANPALLRMIDDGDESGSIGGPVSALVAPDQAASFHALLSAVPGKLIPPLIETVFVRRDGSQFPVEISAGDVPYEGNPALFLIIRDVTEKRRFVDLMLDGIKDGVFTVDRAWNIGYVNSGAEEIMRIHRGDTIGKKFFDVLRPDRPEDERALAGIIESNEQMIEKKIILATTGGVRIPISISGAALSDRNGVVTGAVMIFRDLSAIEALKKEIESSYTFEDIISKNHRILEIFSILPDISESGSTVLIEGPSGTGKELFARAIHNLSLRKAGPFIAINCSAIPETLLESELFGYVKGAFTNALADKPGRFALAEGGTLFLDEIGELPKSLQVKLLRILEEREYEPLGAVASVKTDARIIASTNRSITQEVAAGAFREDLFYRLNVIKISLPQLKDRREDIPLLIDHFLRKYVGSMGKNITGVSEEVLAFLMGYDFPGNVRELENIIEHACVLCRYGVITMKHLPKELTEGISASEPIAALKDRVMDSEKELIKAILAQHNGDRTESARALNIGRTSLWRKMKKYRLL